MRNRLAQAEAFLLAAESRQPHTSRETGFVPEDCELCEAARMSTWFHDDDLCWVAECESCATPMVVWRRHGTAPASDDESVMLAHLERVATELYGEFWLDPNRRSIPDHWHVHARPKGKFYGFG